MRPGAGLPHPSGAVRWPPPLEAEPGCRPVKPPGQEELEGSATGCLSVFFACCVLLELGEQSAAAATAAAAAGRSSEDPARNHVREHTRELFPLPLLRRKVMVIVMIASRSKCEIVVDDNRVLKLWSKLFVQLVNLLIQNDLK